MELFDSEHFYVYENGHPHGSSWGKRGRFSGCHRRSESNKIPISIKSATDDYQVSERNTQMASADLKTQRIASLFDICIEFIAHNIVSLDSLIDFPDTVGKRIFESVVKNNVLLLATDEDCKKVLQTFDKAYGQVLMEELRIKNCAILEYHIGSLCSFSCLTKLDISGCHVGDSHEVLQFAGQLAQLTHLSLRDTCISDDGMRRLTAPLRMFGRGPLNLHLLDLSDNSRITSNCSRYLKCFCRLGAVRLSGTGVTFTEAKAVSSILSLLVKGEDVVNFDCICNSGWAAPIINQWIKEAELSRRVKSCVVSELLPTSSFYHQPKRLIESTEGDRPPRREVVLVSSSSIDLPTNGNLSTQTKPRLSSRSVVAEKAGKNQFSRHKQVYDSQELGTNFLETYLSRPKSQLETVKSEARHDCFNRRELCCEQDAIVQSEIGQRSQANLKNEHLPKVVTKPNKPKPSSLLQALNSSRW